MEELISFQSSSFRNNKGHEKAYLALDNIETSFANHIPLWLFVILKIFGVQARSTSVAHSYTAFAMG